MVRFSIGSRSIFRGGISIKVKVRVWVMVRVRIRPMNMARVELSQV